MTGIPGLFYPNMQNMISQQFLCSQQNPSVALQFQMQAGLGHTNAGAPDPRRFLHAANGCGERGDKLIDRIAFWNAFMPLSNWIVSRLADRLDEVSDRVEHCIKFAGG